MVLVEKTLRLWEIKMSKRDEECAGKGGDDELINQATGLPSDTISISGIAVNAATQEYLARINTSSRNTIEPKQNNLPQPGSEFRR